MACQSFITGVHVQAIPGAAITKRALVPHESMPGGTTGVKDDQLRLKVKSAGPFLVGKLGQERILSNGNIIPESLKCLKDAARQDHVAGRKMHSGSCRAAGFEISKLEQVINAGDGLPGQGIQHRAADDLMAALQSRNSLLDPIPGKSTVRIHKAQDLRARMLHTQVARSAREQALV